MVWSRFAEDSIPVWMTIGQMNCIYFIRDAQMLFSHMTRLFIIMV